VNKYIEALDLLEEYLQDYQKLIKQQKLDRINSPLLLQYRSDIQDITDFFYDNREEVPFNIFQDFEKTISILKELDELLLNLIPEIKRLINLSHYRNKYPKKHWWWHS